MSGSFYIQLPKQSHRNLSFLDGTNGPPDVVVLPGYQLNMSRLQMSGSPVTGVQMLAWELREMKLNLGTVGILTKTNKTP